MNSVPRRVTGHTDTREDHQRQRDGQRLGLAAHQRMTGR